MISEGHLAASDGEAPAGPAAVQPFNTGSSFAYVIAGATLLGRPRRSSRQVGMASVAAGLGSIWYHGPGTAAGRYAHDAGLIWLLGSATLDDLVRADVLDDSWAVGAVPTVAALIGAHRNLSPSSQMVAGAMAIGAAVLGTARRPDGGGGAVSRDALGAGMMLVGSVMHVLGRRGGPLASPPRRVPGHAGWHLASAAAIAIRAR